MNIITFGEVLLRNPSVKKSDVCLYVTQEALDAIEATVGARPAETGGKLFGPIYGFGGDHFEFDENGSAQSTYSRYIPDIKWSNERINHWLYQDDDRMKFWHSDVHSHPGDSGFPSQDKGNGLGDLGYARAVLEHNPWRAFYFTLIVTRTQHGCRLWPWVVSKDNVGEARYAEVHIVAPEDFPPRPDVVPSEEASPSPSDLSTLSPPTGKGTVSPDSTPRPCVTPEPPEDTSKESPQPKRPSYKSSHQHRWSPLLRVAQRGLSAVARVSSSWERAARRKAEMLTNDERYTRQKGLISPNFHNAVVAIVGAGAGSGLALTLARMGIGTLKIFDPDVVELPNLARTAYTMDDLGKPKVKALARHINRINPEVEVEAYQEDILTWDVTTVRGRLGNTNLTVAGTDKFGAQAAINRWHLLLGVPALFIGIHRLGRGGMVVWSIPGETPCYRCVSGHRYRAAASGRHKVDLDGEATCVIDSTFIDTIAAKVGTSLLERHTSSEYGTFLQTVGNRTQIVVRTHPAYRWEQDTDPFSVILSDLPTTPKDYATELKEMAFFALDTLWLPTAVDPDCPDCGGTP